MNQKTLEIVVAVKDLVTKEMGRIQTSLNNFKKESANIAREIDHFGRKMTQLGSKMAFVGAATIAPFAASMKVMEKYSFDVARENERMGNIFLQLSRIISEAAMPTFRAFNDLMAKGVNILNSISPQLREQVTSWILWSGAILLVSGSLLIYAGKLIQAVNVLRLMPLLFNPVTWIIAGVIAAVGLLTLAWVKFRDQITAVLSAIEKSFLEFEKTIIGSIQGIIDTIVSIGDKIPDWAAGLPFVGEMKMAARLLKDVKIDIDKTVQGINSSIKNVGIVSAAGQFGNLANGVQKISQNIKGAVENARTELEPVIKDLQTRLYETSQKFADGFADAFDQVLFEGKSFSESMKSLFQQMGRDIVKDFLKTSMRNVMNSLFNKPMEGGEGPGGWLSFKTIGAFLGGGAKGTQGTGGNKGAADPFTALTNAAKNIGSSFGGLKDKLGDFGNTLGQTRGIFDGVFSALKGFGSNIMSLGGQLLGGIGSLLGSLGGALSGIMGGIGGMLGGGMGGIGGLLGGLFSFFGHMGGLVTTAGIIRYHTGGLAGLRPDEVPAVLQSGEGIVNRSGMGAIGREGLKDLNSGRVPGGSQQQVVNNYHQTVVIKAWDAQDVYRNRKILSGTLVNEIRNNGNLRKAIKE